MWALRRIPRRTFSEFRPRDRGGFDVPLPPPMPELKIVEPIANTTWGKFKMYLHAYPIYFGSSLLAIFAIILPLFAIKSRESKRTLSMSLKQEIEYADNIINSFVQEHADAINSGAPKVGELARLPEQIKSLLVHTGVLGEDDAFETLTSEIAMVEESQ